MVFINLIIFFKLCFPLSYSMISSRMFESSIHDLMYSSHILKSLIHEFNALLHVLKNSTHEFTTSSHNLQISFHDFKNSSNILFFLCNVCYLIKLFYIHILYLSKVSFRKSIFSFPLYLKI